MASTRGSQRPQLADAGWLTGQYVEAGRSVADLAGELDVSRPRVRQALDEAGIARRAPGGSRIDTRARHQLRDRQWLQAQLHDQGLSLSQIAAKVGAGQATVSYWARQHGLQPVTTVERIERQVAHALPAGQLHETPVEWLRRCHVELEWSWPQIAAALDGAVSPRRLQRLAAAYGFAQTRPAGPAVPTRARRRLDDATWLTERYHQQGATVRDIAGELDVAMVTVERAMRRAGILRRRRGPRSHPS